jgi:signal transduction histidine kinase
MEQRSKDIGASFSLKSMLGQGCFIQIALKLDSSLKEVANA